MRHAANRQSLLCLRNLGDHNDIQSFDQEQPPLSITADHTLTRNTLEQHILLTRNHVVLANDDDTDCPSENGGEGDMIIDPSMDDAPLGRNFECESATDDEEVLSAEQLLGEDFEREAANNGVYLLRVFLCSLL